VTPALAGTPRYFAWLYSGEPLQGTLAALFGIEAEINAALQPGLEHTVAHARLGWWSEEAARLRAGAPLHPLTRALLALKPRGAAPPDVSGLVDVATWDLACATFDTGRELAGYCDRWARALTQLAGGWAGAPWPQAPQFGHSLGVALCELQMLNTLAADARLGRVRLPLQELTALGVAPAALARPPWPPALCERLRERHRQLRGALASACALPRSASQRVGARGLLVWAALLAQHSRRAERALPGSGPRRRWDGLADALRAWRSARAALRGVTAEV